MSRTLLLPRGRRATAFPFADSRVQALAGALCVTLCAVTYITNRSLRVQMTGLLGALLDGPGPHHLAWLRRIGLVTRRAHANTYDLTADGLAFSVFCTKVQNRVLARYSPPGSPRPTQPSSALCTIEHHIYQLLATRLPGSLTYSAKL